ncbi:thioredoxin fold domain-containing protein [Pseudomonas taiwanensis]|uniref:DsbC family protein n=1 Tax=Pseudomonas taiwanensis TaxID=470150 RepID=UPI0028DDB5FE|nr:thioredoxin fold domain-containing protein [Pseudomonas taiwanensis]MDT8924944.1 thioredoxin fold domain-containing protein [Pseudomonas taiwanensis]
MQPKSLDKEPENTEQKAPRGQLMNDIAKGAFIVLCLAASYKFMFTDASNVAPAAAQVQTSPLPVTPANTEQAGAPQAPGQIDEARLGQLIKERQAVVAAQGKVVFAASKPATPATTPSAPTSVPPTPTVAAAAPAAPMAGRIAPPGYMAKVGFNNDGTAMPAAQKREQIANALSKIPDSFTVNWKAPQEKTAIYVFTDPTCPYCQKLHAAIPQLNAAGITVHYLLYPRDMARLNGNGSKSVTQQNLDNVWCSLDQQAAMNDAYAGFRVPVADCAALPAELKRMNSPVATHYELGNVFNVQGTPNVFTKDGKDLPGFQSAEKLISEVFN